MAKFRVVFPQRDDLPPVDGFTRRVDAQHWIESRRWILRDNGLDYKSELDVAIEEVNND